MTKKKPRERTLLLNGCSISKIQVYPNNWDKPGASKEIEWYIFYRFYDPLFTQKYPTGRLCRLQGMNEYKTLTERRKTTAELVEQEKDLLINRGFNPITKQFMKPQEEDEIDYLIHPNTEICNALDAAYELLSDIAPGTLKDIRSCLKYFKEAIHQLRLNNKTIKEIRQRHILMIFNQIGVNKGSSWTASNFNFYRSNLGIVFKYLKKNEAIEINPVLEIDKRKRTTPVSTPVLLTKDQRIKIDTDLRKENYRFWRLMHIFFHSGARNTELSLVKYEDVDLEKQSCRYLVKKGRGGYRIIERPIKSIVLHLWKEIMGEAKPGQYLFSKGLKPGNCSINPYQYTRRWKTWVKRKKDADGSLKYGNVGNWYWLKHLNSDEITKLYGTAIAARLNQHSEEILKKHYAVGMKDREAEIIKQADNAFA